MPQRESCPRIEHIEIVGVDTWEGGIEHDKQTMPEVERCFDHNVAIAKKRASHGAVVKKFKKKVGDCACGNFAFK